MRLVNCMRKRRLLADCMAGLWSLEGDAWSAGWSWSVCRKEVACIPPEVHIQAGRKRAVLGSVCTRVGACNQMRGVELLLGRCFCPAGCPACEDDEANSGKGGSKNPHRPG